MVFNKGVQVSFLNEPLKGVVIDCIGTCQVLVSVKELK